MLKQKRKNITKLFAFLILPGLLLSSCSESTASENSIAETQNNYAKIDDNFNSLVKASEGLYLAASNANYQLFLNAQDTEIELRDLRSNKVWYSNPVNRSTDPVAVGDSADELNSQIILNYQNLSSNTSVTTNNYSQAIRENQFDFYKVRNGIGIQYVIGQKVHIDLFPKAISVKRYKYYYSKMDATGKSLLDAYYSFTSIKGMSDEASKSMLLQAYPTLKYTDLYIQGGMIGQVTSGGLLAKEIEASFKKAGYTYADLNSDNTENKVKVDKIKDYSISICIEYTLGQDGLIARIPQKGIQYDSTALELTNVSMLPFFGAADPTEKGYMFLPDGSGALINLNNNKKNVPAYQKDLYTEDNTVANYDDSPDAYHIYMPVYGMKVENHAFLSVIEKGDAVASLNADISGRYNNYNFIYPSFQLKQVLTVTTSMLNASGSILYQKSPISSDLQVHYLFLNGGNANYVGMAKSYRNYLLNNKLLTPSATKRSNYPLYIDAIGSVTYSTTFLGIPVHSDKELTSYQHAVDILSEFKNAGVANLIFGYTGWANGGVNNSVFSSVRYIGALGGKSGFMDLLKYTKENSIDFYPDANFQYVSKNGLFDHFNVNHDTAKDLQHDNAVYSVEDIALLEPIYNQYSWIVSPLKYDTIDSSFLKSFKKLAVSGIDLSSMSTDLNSDFAEGNLIDRTSAEDIVKAQYMKFHENGYQIAAKGANFYSLQYASVVYDSPMSSGENYLIDQTIPFYQIVLHGIIPYTSEPLNLSDDIQEDFLKTIETGAVPYFRFIYEENSVLKNTDYSYYNVNYKLWFNKAVEMYKQIDQALHDCQNSAITAHAQVSSGVYQTTFDNGKTVYVNYNSFPVKVAGLTIGAKNYQVLKDGR